MRTILVTQNNEKEINNFLSNNDTEIFVIDYHSKDNTTKIVFDICKCNENVHLVQVIGNDLEKVIKEYTTNHSKVIRLFK